MPAKLLELTSFAGIRVCAGLGRELASSNAKLVSFADSEWGYVTICVTKFPYGLRHTGNGMPSPSKKSSFGQDLVEAMKLALAHHRGEIELEQVLPKPRAPKSAHKPRTRRTK